MRERHQEILDYVTSYMMDHGYSPTTREIAAGIGVRSSSTVFDNLRDMREAGLINYIDECPRTITVPGYRYIKVRGRRNHDGGVNNQCGGKRAGSINGNKMV